MQRTVLTPVFSVLLTLCVGAGIFAVMGYDPSAALYQFFVAPLSRPDQVADLFVKACPLIIIATGLAFCYRANVWNIGAEGQIVMGAVCAGGVALFFPRYTGSVDVAGDDHCGDGRRDGIGVYSRHFKNPL